MSILTETQLQRDQELASLLNMPLEAVQKLEIASPDSIRIYDKETEPEDKEALYRDYKYLNWPAYLKTLMKTSVKNRHPELFKLIENTHNKSCLDFGSGVGTHSIALLENNNIVGILDVPGKLINFAEGRIIRRGYIDNVGSYDNWMNLPDNEYDVVICADTLEHVSSPLKELKRIHKTMKVGGVLHLLVSEMRKPSSGHFDSSINEWKTTGKEFMKKHFDKIGATLYRKK